jgi:hypothetical protein
MLSGMAKFVWPEHLRLDDALAGVEKISRQFVDPENVLRGFEYGDFIIRNCPSLRVTSANDTYVLQWIEKPTLMLLANPPDSHHDFANASIQCLRYIPGRRAGSHLRSLTPLSLSRDFPLPSPPFLV